VQGAGVEGKPTQLAMFKPPPDVREVHNYVRALEYGLARLEELPLSLRLIREIHAQLMQGVRGEQSTPGQFRRSQNWIGPPGCTLEEATFVPPPVSEMKKSLQALERFLHTPSDLPPLARLGLVHYQFEAIHPFLDGNGRMGRLLLSLLLCSEALLPQPLLYLSAYFEGHRQTYYDLLLDVSQQGAWEPWLAFFLRGVAVQAGDAAARGRQLQDLRERYRQQFQEERSAGRLLQVVDLLFARPVLTMPQIAESLGVNYATATRYIRRLEEAGLLCEITGQARNRIYRADKVLAAIEQPLEQPGELPPRAVR
jgi:Fic family protein